MRTDKKLNYNPLGPFGVNSRFLQALKLIHTTTPSPALNPWFITGFTDGEGCFSISMGLCPRNKKCKLGWEIKLSFNFSLHKKDKALLENIQSYFGVGSINTKHGPQTIKYYVQSACKGRFSNNNRSF